MKLQEAVSRAAGSLTGPDETQRAPDHWAELAAPSESGVATVAKDVRCITACHGRNDGGSDREVGRGLANVGEQEIGIECDLELSLPRLKMRRSQRRGGETETG